MSDNKNQYDVTFGDGKYRIVYDEKMASTVYRHGEVWDRNIVGDGMILALVQEIDQLRNQSEPEMMTVTLHDSEGRGLKYLTLPRNDVIGATALVVAGKVYVYFPTSAMMGYAQHPAFKEVQKLVEVPNG